jgi:hypothetical protein
MAGRARSLAWVVAMSVAVSIMVGVLTSGGDADRIASNGLLAFCYSIAIGVPTTLIFGRLDPRHFTRRPLTSWLTYVGILAATTLLGTFAVRAALALAGLMTMAEAWSGLELSLAVSFAIARR